MEYNFIPARFKISIDGDRVNLFQFIGDRIEGFKMSQIYEELRGSIDPPEFVMVYFYVLLKEYLKDDDEDEGLSKEDLFNTWSETIKTLLNQKLTYKGFMRIYEPWEKKLEKEIKRLRDESELKVDISVVGEKVNRDKIEIYSDEPHQSTNFIRKKESLQYHPVWINSGARVSYQDGLEFFNNFMVNKHVPFVKYIDGNGRQYAKFFDYQHQSSIIRHSEFESKNGMYFIFWNGNRNKTSFRNAYFTASYMFDIQTIKVKIDLENFKREDFERHFQESIPEVKLGDASITTIGGCFTINNFGYNEDLFYYMVLNESPYNSYIYVDENPKARVEKSRVYMHYKHPLGVKISKSNKLGYTSVASHVQISLKMDNGNVIVNILRAVSKQAFDEFKEIFTRFVSRYLKKNVEISQQISKIIGNDYKKKTVSRSKPLLNNTKLDNIKLKAVGMLPAKEDKLNATYARSMCSCKYQPIIIEDDEVKEWQNMKINVNGKLVERTVMKFPPDNPGSEFKQWNFVCPDDTIPHPKLKENKTTGVPEEGEYWYPYLPCCGKTALNTGPGSNYSKYYDKKIEPLPEAKEALESVHRLSVGKIIRPGRIGTLPNSIIGLLNKGTERDQDFLRIGVPESRSSAIDSILIALEDKEYLDGNSIQKIDYVHKIRVELSKRTYPGLYKQELYDYDDQKIMNNLVDPNVLLDTSLYYRGLEEMFNINIFVVDSNSDIEIPRHKISHYRVMKDRRSVILYKNYGEETRVDKYPQYELIISQGDINRIGSSKYLLLNPVITGKQKKLFGQKMTSIMYLFLQKKISDRVFSFENEILRVRKTPFNKVSWEKVFTPPYEIIGQSVDSYGKVKILQVLNKDTNIKFSIYVPQGPPLNVPLIQGDSLNRANSREIINAFGNPSVTTRNGLWYNIGDIYNGMFIISEEQKDPDPLPKEPIDGESKINKNNINLLMRKYTSFFTQIVNWLWRLDRGKLNVEQWFDKWVEIREKNLLVKEGGIPYHYSPDFTRRFPNSENLNTEGGLDMIKSWWPEYFGKKIFMYRELRDKLLSLFLKRSKDTEGLPLDDYSVIPPPYIVGFLEDEKDFKKFPGTVIFTNKKSIDSWLEQKSGRLNYVDVIYNKVEIGMSLMKDPYIYHDSDDGKMYLIQNVLEGDIERAVNVTFKWREKSINVGYHSEKTRYNYKTIPRVIYSFKDKIVPVEILTEQNDFIQLLRYSKGKYAAMIPLL